MAKKKVPEEPQKMVPPFKQIAVAVHPPYGEKTSYEAVYGLDEHGRVWRLLYNGWAQQTPFESETHGWEPFKE